MDADLRKVTVHTLSEFMFCNRAGAIAFAQQEMDEVDEPPKRVNLDYLPNYDIALIEEAIAAAFREIRWLVSLGVVLIAGTTFLWSRGFSFGVLTGTILLGLAGWRLIRRIRQVVIRASRRREALTAAGKEPLEALAEMQQVNWWALLRAGYESEVLDLVLYDDELQLAGRAWRVLKKGSLRIPVVKVKRPATDDLPIPKAHHCARVTAYCRLIERNIGGESPFGIVLFGDSYQGWTVPKTPVLQAELVEIVKLARSCLAGKEEVLGPATTALCKGCPHGEPMVVSAENTRSGRTSPVDGKLYQSHCGDRFAWFPPHAKAKSLRLC
jgi:hypothetical protein